MVKPTSMKLDLDLVAAVDAAARSDLRSRSKQIERYIREGLARDGVSIPDPPRADRSRAAE